MISMPKTSLQHLLFGICLFALLLVAGYFLFVGTAAGQAFDNVAYFGHRSVDREALRYDSDILGLVSVRAIGIAIAVLGVISLIRWRIVMGVLAIIGMVMAVSGAEMLKHKLPRHELSAPSGPVPSYFQEDTYPSGHTTIGTSIVLALLLVMPARWRPWLAGVAGLVSASYGTAVLFAGWHRPSDALGGVLWSGLCLGLVAAIGLALRRRMSPPGRVCWPALGVSGILCLFALFFAWFSTGWLGPQLPEADFSFLVMTGLIVLAAFSVTAWFAWALQAEDDLR